jgi:hypothetical protein
MTAIDSRASRRLPASGRFASSHSRTAARYEARLLKRQNRLREALAREEALRRQNDELMQRQSALSELLAARCKDVVDRVASLTPRQFLDRDLQ